MGFFDGIAKVITAPFKGVAEVARGIGDGIGSIIHGSQQQQKPAPEYVQQQACGCQGSDPRMAMQMLQFQNALMLNMMLYKMNFSPAMLCGC